MRTVASAYTFWGKRRQSGAAATLPIYTDTYQFGGYDGAWAVVRNYRRYVMATDAWAYSNNFALPTRAKSSGFSLAGLAYSCGGTNFGGGIYANVQVFTLATDASSVGVALPAARSTAHVGPSAIDSDKGHYIDGYDNVGVMTQTNYQFSLAGLAWSSVTSHNVTAFHTDGVISPTEIGNLHLYGGNTPGLFGHEQYLLATDSWATKQIDLYIPSSGGGAHTLAVDTFMVYAGNSGGWVATAKQYTLSTNSWAALTNMSGNLTGDFAAGGDNNGNAYRHGGYDRVTGLGTTTVVRWNVAAAAWQNRTACPVAYSWNGGASVAA